MSLTRRTTSRILMFVLLAILPAWAEQLTFQRAMQLAMQNSPKVDVASAEQLKAEQAYRELRNQYMPNLVFGSGLGWSYGYPLSLEGSAPSIFNVNYQSALYNPSLSQYSKSAKSEWMAAAKNTEDLRKDAMLELATNYIQLDTISAELKTLREQQAEANKLAEIVAQRAEQGIESKAELKRSKLLAARVNLRIVETEGNATLLRTRLSQLTGIPADEIETVSKSIPSLPDLTGQDNVADMALQNSSTLEVAQHRAEAQQFRANGERKALFPQLDLVAQYGLFSKFNNYEEFFTKFQRNNATMGVSIRFPFLNFSQRSRAAQADAEAIKAKKQVEVVRDQISSETLKLQAAVRQLAAAQRVAQLEYELAQAELESTQIRSESSASSPQPGGPGVVTARDLASARIQATDKHSQYLNTTFELEKAQLQLLRATGQLESWAMPSP